MMLPLPNKAVNRSINVHNVDFSVLADWVEATLAFDDCDQLSSAEAVSELLAQYIYEDDDFCAEGVANVWAELVRRATWMGSACPFTVDRKVASGSQAWADVPAASFCLFLSLSRVYHEWSLDLGPDYTEQGELFERLSSEAAAALLPEWKALKTGWSRSGAKKLRDVVPEVADHLGLTSNPISPWADENANEAGLDLVVHRAFADHRSAEPIYLIQCASGLDWKGKRQSPDPRVWMRLVTFINSPCRGLTVPFALTDKVFAATGNIVDGLVLDRCRLMSAGSTDGEVWVSEALRNDLVTWLGKKWSLIDSLQ